MNEIQKEQPSFDRAVCDAMVASTPDEWSVIVLTLERLEGATAIGELSHSLTNAEGDGLASPSDSLYEATYRLDELFHRHSKPFRRAIYRVELLPESWRYSADFQYDPAKAKPRHK